MPTYLGFVDELISSSGTVWMTCRRVGPGLSSTGNLGGDGGASALGGGVTRRTLRDCSQTLRDCRVHGGGGRGDIPRPSTRRATRTGDETESVRIRP